MAKTPDDYDIDDGYNSDSGLEECPHCDTHYSLNGGYTGTVYDQQGREFDIFLDADPEQGPFFCPGCWDELETNRKREENNSLEAWL